MDAKELLEKLKALENPKNKAGMARFGIKPKTQVLGISIPKLREIAKLLRKSKQKQENHKLAMQLWNLKIHEARLLACFIADPLLLKENEIKKMAESFDSWDICDQACMNLFDKSPLAIKEIARWAGRKEEFVKRTAFSLIASLAFHDKKANDKFFIKYFPLIKKASLDERNFVRKSVNWALRQIGKRNKSLNKKARALAKEILALGRKKNVKSAQWIANDAIRELNEKLEKITA